MSAWAMGAGSATKRTLQNLQAQLDGYRTAHQRADQRLDRSGKALVEALGDVVVEHSGGRTTGVTSSESYDVHVNNDPFSPAVTLVATVHDVPSQTWALLSDANGDFDEDMLEEMEKWTVGAKTGVPVDDDRHLARAAAVNNA